MESHQKWLTLSRGAILPSFLQEPPPVFAAAPSNRSTRVVVVGDFGREGPSQSSVASAIGGFARTRRVDFGLMLGDNFEPDGVTGPADRRWKSGWQSIYDPPGIHFFAVTGNHDCGLPESPAAEILFSQRSCPVENLYTLDGTSNGLQGGASFIPMEDVIGDRRIGPLPIPEWRMRHVVTALRVMRVQGRRMRACSALH